MSKLTSLIRRAPKRFSAVVAMIAVAVIVPAAVFAWGPTRTTFTIEKPATYNTFNSITNNPNIGDERNFVGIRETTAANVWNDDMTVQPGKEYYVRMYVHNNAAANLNQVAENVTAKFNLPTTTGKSVQVNGFLNSSNSNPTEVYDHATFNSPTDFNLAYVSGSLKYENNAFGPNGTPLSESIFTSTGAKLGYDKLDGKIPGCFQYAGYVTFKVKPQFAKTTNFSLSKTVSKHGANKWAETYAAQPGETVDFLLQYKNTGEVRHDDVTFRDTLPTGLSYVAGSNTWTNTLTANNPVTNNDLTNGTGINVGSYLPGGGAYTIFSAKVAEKDQLKCGDNSFVNKGKVNTGGYAIEDTATVTVKKECQPTKITVCELATKKIVTINETDFNPAKYSKDLKDCEEKKITVCELATKKIVTIKESDFNPAKYSKDLKDCEEKKIVVCELATYKIVTIKESEFNTTKYSKDLKDCDKITVCELATKKIVTIRATDFDAKKYSKDLKDCETPTKIVVCELATKKIVTINEKDFDTKKYSKNLNDCKTPEKITVCEIATKQIVTIEASQFNESKYTKDLSVCAETPVPPVTPPELPTTGAGDSIVAVLGLGALVAAVSYYIASRRALGL